MKHALSWEHGKQKLAAAVALLLIAISLALTPAITSLESARPTSDAVQTSATVQIKTTSFSLRGSTWS